MDDSLFNELAVVSREAGALILDVYNSDDIGLESKADNSPLTRADKLSHEHIAASLKRLAPNIPVISEEGDPVPYASRSGWPRFFLVDPLDGTKEFVKRNGEFTVNIALIDGGVPVGGVIYVPLQDKLYMAAPGMGAFVSTGAEKPEKISVSKPKELLSDISIVASRSHGTGALDDFLKVLPHQSRISAGSSLKFCMVAEGKADLYPRFGPIWEWDTAAGHAILREAGGRVMKAAADEELDYNKESLLHKNFIAIPEWLLDKVKPYLDRVEL